MRTTLDIEDHLYQQLKLKAATEGRTLTSIVEEALRDLVIKPKETKPFRLNWITRKGQLMPGVNLDDRDSLYDLMDGRT